MLFWHSRVGLLTTSPHLLHLYLSISSLSLSQADPGQLAGLLRVVRLAAAGQELPGGAARLSLLAPASTKVLCLTKIIHFWLNSLKTC